MIAHLAAALVLSCGQPPDTPPANSLYLPPNLYLVRATATKKWKKPRVSHATAQLRVTGVIAGPERLIGKDFSCLVGSRNPLASGPMAVVLDNVVLSLEQGAEGVWWVYEDEKGNVRPELRPAMVEKYGIGEFPYQKTQGFELSLEDLFVGMRTKDPRLEGVPLNDWEKVTHERRRKEEPVWVEAVTAVYAAKTDEARRGLLEKYAAAPASPVSAWAVALLARGPKEPAVKFLRGLAGDAKLDPEAQAALDRELCRLDPDGWPDDPARRALLRRWMDPEGGNYLFVTGCRRLLVAATAGEISPKVLGDAIAPAVAAADRLSELQLLRFGELLAVSRYPVGNRAAAYEFLLGVARTAKLPRVRMEAARGIQQFRPLPDELRKDIQDLWDHEKEPVVLQALDVLLRDRRPK